MKRKSKLPKVSIVTPSYNQGQFIQETIESVLSQSYPNIEHIVVDGGSNDETHQILEKYKSSIDKIIIEPDNGQSDAINKGFRIATGELVGWLNSDDILLPHTVELLVDSYNKYPDAVIFYGDVIVFNNEGEIIRTLKPSQRLTYRQLVNGSGMIVQPGSFYRCDVVNEVNMLRPEFYFMMDRDLWLRILCYGNGVHIGNSVAKFRIHASAKSSKPPFKYLEEFLKLEHEHPSDLFSRRKFQLLRGIFRCFIAKIKMKI
jgi:glycosyltransferase involved in cell wall biosynthesis